ncbi:hypothetical protein CRG98_001868 [Punica granatum]|uniref:Uncharacterized protein n=1 Tax=Punica granatum TaxID=22663 RepID=A0A2I0LAN0_PUNGR|nr:hypothetical protein CRG98_001868 [Punica granatum]
MEVDAEFAWREGEDKGEMGWMCDGPWCSKYGVMTLKSGNKRKVRGEGGRPILGAVGPTVTLGLLGYLLLEFRRVMAGSPIDGLQEPVGQNRVLTDANHVQHT